MKKIKNAVILLVVVVLMIMVFIFSMNSEKQKTGTIVETGTMIGEAVEYEVQKTHRVFYRFNELTIKNYSSFKDSKNYCFAHRVTINGEYYGYISVMDNDNGGVSNHYKEGLYGCAYGVNIEKYSHAPIYNSESFFDIKDGGTYRFAVRGDKNIKYKYVEMPKEIYSIEVDSSLTNNGVELLEYETVFNYID